jgi:hypothetical protein
MFRQIHAASGVSKICDVFSTTRKVAPMGVHPPVQPTNYILQNNTVKNGETVYLFAVEESTAAPFFIFADIQRRVPCLLRII